MIKRIWLLTKRDFTHYLQRPMVWVWVVLLLLMYWGLTAGNVRISTGGDSAIGGTKQFLSSEFEVARIMTALTMVFHGFFVSILYGMCVIHDQESGIMPLLHSSKLRPAEYLFAKFLGCSLIVALVLTFSIFIPIFFMYVVPNATREEYIGPFALANFVNPAIKFVVPSLILIGAMAFALGTITRKAILVFVFPTVMLILFGMFLNNWSPIWLPNWVNNALNHIDPFGSRWLEENYFKVDRGADFYNTAPIAIDWPFVLSRVGISLAGFLLFLVTVPLFRKQLHGASHGPLSAIHQVNASKNKNQESPPLNVAGLKPLQMVHQPTSMLRDIWNITIYELRELKSSPSLYLFVPFVLLETIGTAFIQEGVFGTPILHTSGTLAVGLMDVLAVLGCLMMMFYTVESQMRERIKRLAPIYFSTPAKSFAMLLGKSLANIAICVGILLAALLACLIIILIQMTVPFQVVPFLLIWGLVLIPTYLVWTSFITFAVVITRNRYSTYAIGATALIATLYFRLSGNTNWVFNWMATGTINWSDISILEIDRIALILNRLLMVAMAILFTYLASAFYWRQSQDAVQIATRLRPKGVLRFAMFVSPFLLGPIFVGGMLWTLVNFGVEGAAVKAAQKKYWRQNFATWNEVKQPSISGVNVTLELNPSDQFLSVTGVLRLTNDQKSPMKRFAMSRGAHWKDVSWKFSPNSGEKTGARDFPVGDGLPAYEPEERSGLYVFQFDPPLKPGESALLQYSFNGHFPDGITKNGGGAGEFILPSGVVLTSFSTSFMPTPGMIENAGLAEKDRPEAKVYEKDFFEEELKPLFGGGDHFNVRTTVIGPADFTFNGVGIKRSDSSVGDKRTVVWESDNPVSFFNVVGGRWSVFKSEHTEIYYNPQHEFNVHELSEALEAARVCYARWFAPYPWKELKLSEFPALASYAQGFATNITFSESIGFLTLNSPGADAPFMVAAHEAAHQWWGNMLVPGKGPGGNILSEGMAHFSTGLLFDEVKGLRARIAFFHEIEKQYGERRSVDSERPMVEVDGSKDGDTTVMYDRGGWVFWMLLNNMGRAENLEGLQSFIKFYSQSKDDYPVLQDFVNHMREFAKDKPAFDEFVNQWIFDKVVPEYKLSNVTKTKSGNEWLIAGSVKNVGTGRMPLQICVSIDKRFVENELNKEYQDARATVTLGAGEEVTFEIQCPFEPDKVTVDPDALVLQLKRKFAVFEF